MGTENLAPTTVGTVRGSNPAGGKIFRTRQYRPWGPIRDPVEWLPGLFPCDKAPGAWPWTPIPSKAKVKEGVELYLWSFMASPRVNFTLPRIKKTWTMEILTYTEKYKHLQAVWWEIQSATKLFANKFLHCLTLKVKALWLFETSITIYQWTWHNVLTDVNIQQINTATKTSNIATS